MASYPGSATDNVNITRENDGCVTVPALSIVADHNYGNEKMYTTTDGDSVDLCSVDSVQSQTSDTSNEIEMGNEENDLNINSQPGQGDIAVPDPYIGQEFGDEEAVYDFYNMYAKELGFSVRKGRVERSRVDKRKLSRTFVCSNEGSKYNNDKRRRGINYQPRVSKKTNCGAAMRIKPRQGIWVVDTFVKDHNHELVDPSQSFRLRSHQKASMATVQLIDRLHRCGISPTQVCTILKDFAGGEQHAGINDVRFRSIFRSKRKKSLGVDCQLAVNYLETKRELDPNFYYSISVSKEGEMTGIFWVDGRAREQYTNFGDVIVFDTTYRKNKYRFPFAPFTGVNHHMQSILLGCGLISDETKESFEWLFSTWLHAMQSVHPSAISTDEDPGISRAVKSVFPNTIHRLCAWHLEKHRMSHMEPLY